MYTYSIHNQLTGTAETASSFDEAKTLQARIKQEYMDSIADVFAITVIINNDDGSSTQVLADNVGNPIIHNQGV